MANWTAGYAAQVDYTHGYFKELNPLNSKLALLDAGIAPPALNSACELGFGQGLSVNIHAAASNTRWYGTDFSPSQAGFAQQMAQSANSQAQLADQSFAEFAQRDDLPDFDFIGLHGIWAWVSDENRRTLVDFIAQKLKVGGVLYISYNTQAGWAAMMPIRHLLHQHAQLMTARGANPVETIQAALAFVDEFLRTQPAYLKANPEISRYIEFIKGQDPHYLVHEYLSQDWKSMNFSDMSEWLSGAKLDYVCSAYSLDQINALNLSEAAEQLIAQQDNALFQQTLRDLSMNQQFRKDYWVKGARQLDAFEQMEQLMALRLVMTRCKDDIELSATGVLGPAKLKAETYQPIIDFFADYQVKTLQQLASAMQAQGIGFDKVMQAVMILSGKEALALAQDEDSIAQARDKTARLNRFILQKARANDAIQCLASPVTGGGIELQGYEMLFMLATQFGHDSTASIAQFSWGLLKQRGIRLHRQGQWLERDDENIAELEKQIESFKTEPLKLYQALGIN